MDNVDDNSTKFYVGTPVSKVFGKVEHQGKVTGYNPVTKLYHTMMIPKNTNTIKWEINNRELSKREDKEKLKSVKIHHLHSKYAPEEFDYVEHVMTLTVQTIRYVASLWYILDMSTKDDLLKWSKLLLIL